MKTYAWTQRPIHRLNILMLFLLVCLLAACGSTTTPGGSTGGGNTGGQGGSTPTPGTTPASTATVGSTPIVSGTPGVNGPDCAEQASLLSFRMLDSSHGWALNVNAILKTSDGGRDWTCVTPAGWVNKIGMEARATYLLDDLHAWVVPTPQASDTVTVLRTSDGRQTWQSTTFSDSLPVVVDPPHFINTQEGWLELVPNGGPGAGSESADIFHTTDGGQTWMKIASTDNPGSGLPRGGIKTGISFEDSMNGWATGGDYSTSPWLYVTHDGGSTWQKQQLADYPGFIGTPSTHVQYMTTPPVFFGTTGLLPLQVVGQLDQGPQAAVHGFLLYVTHNGGQSWNTFWKTTPGTLTSFQTTLQGLYIVDPQHAWAVNQNTGTMYNTSDGGQSWHQMASVGQVTSMSFVDGQQGWLISQNGFQRTVNGGNTWQYIPYYYPH